MQRIYPFCLNSKRWLTVMLSMNLPKSCPNQTEQECEYEKCTYYEEREATPYLLKLMERFMLREMKIINCVEE